jgi:hypothetical protein
MKEEDKYYKPELDEIYTAPDLFYTGEGLFSDKILINPFLYRSKEVSFDLRDVLNLNIVLVKYLDKEDIESFGFTIKSESHPEFKNIDNIGPDAMYFTGNLNDKELMLFYSVEINKLEIWDKVISNKDYTSYQSLFIGFIKNKSELKVLLKQLLIMA